MDKEISEDWNVKLLTGLGNGLRNLQRSGLYCDVTVTVNDVSYKCHKAVLCASSPYFTAMFSHDMEESRDSAVVLHDTQPGSFELLLDCIYNGRDIVNDKTAQDVLEIASLVQIDIIIDRCESFFAEKLNIDNFIDIWYMAKKYNCKRLEKVVWSFMLENFSSLMDTDDISLLPIETMWSLLRDDSLNVKNEDNVCDAAIKWLTTNVENREETVSKLITSLRLPLCSPEYIIKRFSEVDFFRAISAVNDAIQKAFKYRICLSQKQNSASLETTHRASSRQDDVMVIIGGTDNSEYAGAGMRCYSFLRNKWFSLSKLPENVGPHFAMCTYGDDIFVSGGQYHKEVFHKFQASTCSWLLMPKMMTGRYQHAMVATTDVIYTIGGETTDTIDEYQIQTGIWEKSSELLNHVPQASAEVLNHTIIIVGCNHTENCSSCCDSVQVFDTLNKQVTLMQTAASPGNGYRMVTCDRTVYIIAADGLVSTVTGENEQEILGKVYGFANGHKFGVVQFRGKLYITTASTNYTKQTSVVQHVQVVDLTLMAVTEATVIPPTPHGSHPWLCNGSRLACAKISIGKHHLHEEQ